MQEVVAEHELFHTVALNTGSALSQHDKVINLLCSVKGAPAYDFTVNSFKHTFPTMQQQTFANLKAALIIASRSIEAESASVGLSAMDAGHSAAFGACWSCPCRHVHRRLQRHPCGDVQRRPWCRSQGPRKILLVPRPLQPQQRGL